MKIASLLFFSFLALTTLAQKKHWPDTTGLHLNTDTCVHVNDTLVFKGRNSLRKNAFGQYEMYLEGSPYQIGNDIGELDTALYHYQQNSFLSNVDKLVPSKSKQFFLRKFLKFYNRKLPRYINEEYKLEILGISKYNEDKYDYIAGKYMLNLYLHGAHDIGHALSDLAMVGCTSFAVWGDQSVDGNLIIGRNFDFYAGDNFSKNKVIYFVNPEKGYKFMSVSWSGIVGVMSGMNEKGLTVTINASKSDIPLKAKTPISLVAREILQNASNIEEAIAIAQEKEVFVSESILVGSAEDNSAVIIEISPKKFGVYSPTGNRMTCSNHFQCSAYADDENNQAQILNSHSAYRLERLNELLNETPKMDPLRAVKILRNKEGVHNDTIGLGNEKALNQLIAHHGIVFQPASKTVWVSSNPYQLGAFVSFHLDSVFSNPEKNSSSFALQDRTIALDSFQFSQEFINYQLFKASRDTLLSAIEAKTKLDASFLDKFQHLNPYFWETDYLLGRYYHAQKFYEKALLHYETALKREVTTLPDREEIEKRIEKIKKKIK